jgi:hypothetical protein
MATRIKIDTDLADLLAPDRGTDYGPNGPRSEARAAWRRDDRPRRLAGWKAFA